MSSPVYIDDNGAVLSSGWTNFPGQGFLGAVHFAPAGAGAMTATWPFVSGQIPFGAYDVAVTWTPYSNRAANAPYSINGGAPVLVNQQLSPADFNDAGVGWKRLGIFAADASGGVSVTLTNNANGYVIADAVRLLSVNVESFLLTDTSGNPKTVTFTQNTDGTWTVAGIQ